MFRKTLSLVGILALLLSVFAFTSGKAHAASLDRTTGPRAYPTNCLTILGGTSNTTRSPSSLSYDVTARVRNGCTSTLLKGGGWIANFQVDCAGTLIDESPELMGNMDQINVGATFLFLDDAHFVSTCYESNPQIARHQFTSAPQLSEFAPDQVTIYISASGNLQSGPVATGSDYFIAA